MTRRRSSATSTEEVSAGGVVVNDSGEVVVIVPTRRAANGSKVLALPKGHVDPGETPSQAARREVREEAGVEAVLVDRLGDVRYWYQREGRRIPKRVTFFLFDYVSGDVADHDQEVEEARWMPLEEAGRELTYKGEREMVERAVGFPR
jgi:mutator protein MutT